MPKSELSGVGHLQSQDVDERTGKLFLDQFNKNNRPVMIMIHGSYCGHCKAASPAYRKLALEQMSLIKSGKDKLFMVALQSDDKDPRSQELMKFFPAILERQGIKFMGVPTYVVYRNGRYEEYKQGRDEASLQRFIQSL